jgi:HD-GYP domain-containing protein (c-di-GMP phosphodiesterase class II)
MKSLRKLVIIIITLIIIVQLSLSIMDHLYVKPLNKYLSDINESLYNLNEVNTEIKLQLKIMEKDIDNMYNDKLVARISNTYINNYSLLIYDTNLLKMKSKRLLQTLSKIDKSIIINRNSFSGIKIDITKLNQEVNIFNDSVKSLDQQELHNRENFNKILLIYDNIEKLINSSNSKISKYIKSAVYTYMTINRTTDVTIFVILFILVTLLYKLLLKDFQFIIDGFQLLNNYDYDINKLPKNKHFFLEQKVMYKAVYDVIKKEKTIDTIKNVSSGEYMLQDTLEKTFSIINNVLDIDRIGLAFVNYYNRTIVAEHGVFKYNEVLLGPGFEVNFEDTTLAHSIESKNSFIMRNINDELRKRPNSSALNLLRKEGIVSSITVPLIINDIVTGFLFFSSFKFDNFSEKDLILAENISHEISTIIDKTYLTQKMLSSVGKSFADIVEKKDNETGDHNYRMATYAKIIAKSLLNHEDKNYRLTNKDVNDIENNAPIHDIGKVGIPDSILKKPGKLNEEEWDIMKTPTLIGADILTKLNDSLKIFNSNFYESSIAIAKYHHERWDGTGYPEGLSGLEIPLFARIIAIADVFDAISSKRVYKESYGFEKSVEIINAGAGNHFDPELVRCFNLVLYKIRQVYDGDRRK